MEGVDVSTITTTGPGRLGGSEFTVPEEVVTTVVSYTPRVLDDVPRVHLCPIPHIHMTFTKQRWVVFFCLENLT